ncbi:MAG: hypothetical protein K8W52_09200 [Deltaproteobacteria bacterium]|nr:hypothetical protein [Deltaproteobacteria bacterium]
MPIDASRAPGRAPIDQPLIHRACAILLAIGALGATRAHADEATPSPVRIELRCDGGSRSAVCPTFVRGLIEETSVLAIAPQATAEVTLFVNTVAIGGTDRVHFRFVGRAADMVPQVDLDVDIDPRASDDAQRALLRRGLARGVARYVEPRFPDALEVTLGPARSNPGVLSPWDVSLRLGAFATRTRDSAWATGRADVTVKHTTTTAWQALDVSARGYRLRWTEVDGTGLQKTTIATSSEVAASARGAFQIAPHWSVGARAFAVQARSETSTRATVDGEAGIEWDAYRADDPRGNQLAVAYLVGGAVDRVTGYETAYAAYQRIVAHGSLRIDRAYVGLQASIGAALHDPATRHALGVTTYLSLPVGPHVDLSLQWSMSRSIGPGFAPGIWYTPPQFGFDDQPLDMDAAVSLTFHGDRTNGARNDRFTALD